MEYLDILDENGNKVDLTKFENSKLIKLDELWHT